MSHKYPSSHVFYRKLTREYPRIVRGDGCYLYDDRGRRYLDGSGGAYVVNVGLIVWPNAAQLADRTGDLAMLAPPFVIDEQQIGEMVALFGRAVEQTVTQLAAAR